jgi:hypothetical protein
MSDPFGQAGAMPEDVLRLAEAYVFANPDPVTAHTGAAAARRPERLPRAGRPAQPLRSARRHAGRGGRHPTLLTWKIHEGWRA